MGTLRPGFVALPVLLSFALCLVLAALIAWGVARGVIGSSAAVHISGGAPAGAPPIMSAPDSGFTMLVLRTLAVAAGIAALATVLAIPAAWAMRRVPASFAGLLIMPMLLPSYLAYTAWGLLRAPGSWLGDLLESGHDSRWFVLAGWVQAIFGLMLWVWPVAALILASSVRAIDPEALDALRLSGAGPFARARVMVGLTRAGIVASFGVVFLIMLGSAVPLHLANINTWAIAVWRDLSETGGSARVWRSAAPLVLIGAAAGWAIGSRLIGVAGKQESEGGGEIEPLVRGRRIGVALRWLVAVMLPAVVVWSLSVLVPLWLLAARLRHWDSLGRFVHDARPAIVNSLEVAAAGGVGAVLITVGTAMGLSSPERSVARRLGMVSLRMWLAMALVPGVIVGSALVVSSASDVTTFLADTGAGVVAAHLARFGAVAALTGWWLSRSEPRTLRDLRLLSSHHSASGWWAAVGRPGMGVIFGAVAGVFVLSLHEIEASVVISPPGNGTLAEHMLSLLHYLRDEQLTAGAVLLLGGSLVVGVAALVLMARGFRGGARMSSGAATVMLIACLIAVAGCERTGANDSAAAGSSAAMLVPTVVIGEPGRAPGQFVTPRAIDTDGKALIVVDKTGRCQRFSPEGKLLSSWMMPAVDRGKPTGVTVGPDGRVYVADSHEHRVAVYRVPADGALENEMAGMWGEYGTGPGQFTFPSDLLFVSSEVVEEEIQAGGDVGGGGIGGRIYVSEYGGNDRLSVFDAATHAPLFTFGHDGSATGLGGDTDFGFRRPQAMLLDRATRTIVVADACNHRLGVFTLGGKPLRWIGRADCASGDAPGEFSYPYALCAMPDRSVLVVEYGNSRLQRIDLDSGKCLGLFCGVGRGPGQLAQPWGACILNGTVFVADAQNSRVQGFDLAAMMRAGPVASASRSKP